jgi:hypothetical protein
MNLIKVLNPVKAKKLELAGFKYTKEVLENKDVIVFQETQELLKELQSDFTKADYFKEKTMNFGFKGGD